jgi:uncharacterized membrane protein YsdA (DUF1294 family)
MTLGIALVLIFVLYLVDKNKVWRQAGMLALGVCLLGVIGILGVYGWDKYAGWKEVKREEAELERYKVAAGESTNAKPPSNILEIHGGETLKVVETAPPPSGFVIDKNPNLSSGMIPIVYFGHHQTIMVVCGNFGEEGSYTATDKNGEITCN